LVFKSKTVDNKLRNSNTRYENSDLASWLKIYHPEYNYIALGLGIIGLLQAGLVYLDLTILSKLVASFTNTPCSGASCDDWIDQMIAGFSAEIGMKIPVIFLVIYCLALSLRAVIIFGKQHLEGLLSINSQSDIEREIFKNLLRKDEQFFQHHSAAEIINRLSMDIVHVLERRRNFANLWFALVTITGSVYFFLQQGTLIAVVGVGTIVLGVLVSNYLQRSMPLIHGQKLKADDAVKDALEEYMSTVPEIQVSNLHSYVVQKFSEFQHSRWKVFMNLITLQGKLAMNYTISYMMAFLAVVYTIFTLGRPELIAAVIRAFPELHGNISDIGNLIMRIRMAGPSISRILEYASPLPKEPSENSSSLNLDDMPTIKVENVNYRFSTKTPLLGGNKGINTTILPNKLISFVGSSGSGKSTLSQIILGRMKPENGNVFVNDVDMELISAQKRSELFAYMPQTAVLLDKSIFDNLKYGCDVEPGEESFNETSLEVLRNIGVCDVAISKALEMYPASKFVTECSNKELEDLRRKIQADVQKRLDIRLVPYSNGIAGANHPLIFHIVGGSIDSSKLLAVTRSKQKMNQLKSIVPSRTFEQFIEVGKSVLKSTNQLLSRFKDVDTYNRVAPFPLNNESWGLRSALLDFVNVPKPPEQVRSSLFIIGLLAFSGELEDQEQIANAVGSLGEKGEEFKRQLAETLDIHATPFKSSELNQRLNWRDNLLFAKSDTSQQRKISEIDRIILDKVKTTFFESILTQCGFAYRVGRGGRRLSGGQRQMICLGRTLLRKVHIYILDEPTAALDPLSRSRVNKYLKTHAKQSTILAITHDAKLAEQSDEVIMMKDGGLHIQGEFSNLAKKNSEFSDVLGKKGA